MDLREWTVHHIKQKDMVKNDLVSFKEEGDKVICEYKSGRATYFCRENLSLDEIKGAKEDEMAFFVCTCNEHNFKTLVDNWGLMKAKPKLTLVFLNLGSHEKWIIKPHVHAKIADPSTLKQGLRTMYETCLGTAKN